MQRLRNENWSEPTALHRSDDLNAVDNHQAFEAFNVERFIQVRAIKEHRERGCLSAHRIKRQLGFDSALRRDEKLSNSDQLLNLFWTPIQLGAPLLDLVIGLGRHHVGREIE